MTFILQWLDGTAVSLQRVEGSELRIGRGTDAQIRSDNVAVALTHAVIETAGDEYVVDDQGSITGTYVNERTVDRHTLRKGDRIEIGDLRLTVQEASGGKPLFLRIERTVRSARGAGLMRGMDEQDPAETLSRGSVIVSRALDYDRKYSIRRRLLSRRSLGWLALLVTALIVAQLLTGRKEEAFMPGGLSAAHASAVTVDGRRVIEADDCHACHVAFEGPSNALCEGCHQQAFHQMGTADAGDCAACHTEHRSLESLTTVSDRFCVECHDDLSEHGEDFTVARSVSAFGANHPEFQFLVDRENNVRIPAGDPALMTADPNPLKFDHECHLSGDCRTRPPQPGSRETLVEDISCASCHELDLNRGSFDAITFDAHCSRCHVLTFDNRFDALPHGLPLEAVAGIVANAYGGTAPLLRADPSDVGRIVSRSTGESPASASRAVRVAQRTIQARCEECHELEGGQVQKPATFATLLPEMRTFDHAVHLSSSMDLTCVTCHIGISSSSSSATYSMPTTAQCTSCHGGEVVARPTGLAACSTCHYYHDLTRQHGGGWTVKAASLGLPSAAVPVAQSGGTDEDTSSERSGMTMDLGMMEIVILAIGIIFAFIAGIMLVGWFALRREKRKLDKQAASGSRRSGFASAAPAPSGAAPAPAPSSGQPSSAQAGGPGATPKGSAPKTMMMTRRPSTIPDAPEGATVAVKWQGSIAWTSGPLEGMRLPIDDSGFYIGRDKEMAQMVIDDPRISRRHVWVGIRDGNPTVVDQGSTNGTFLNDVNNRISESVLKSGDEVILSEDVARFRFDA